MEDETPIENEDTTYPTDPLITYTTACAEHEWVRADDDPNSDMESYVCTNCGSGMNKARDTDA